MSVLRILMAVPTSAQTLPEVIDVHVTMGTACQAMAYCVMVSHCKVEIMTSNHLNVSFVIDIDECSENRDNCRQLCRNTPGSYSCSCHTGYRLTSDGVTCEGNAQHIG